MKVIDLEKERLDLPDLLRLARQEPVLLVTAGGEEFVVSEADDFEDEVEQLRTCASFQHFLEQRAAETDVLSLDELEALLDAEMEDVRTQAVLHETKSTYEAHS
jgi:PHD/YefM family antitoxin component YafN of YafNO toxin-antitoxin module